MTSNTVRFKEFRVYAGKRDGAGLYVTARVFASKREMLTALRAEADASGSGEGFANHTQGAMQTFKAMRVCANGNTRVKPCLGRVNFFYRRMGMEVVTHEFAHAAFAWAERKHLTGKLHEMPNEEQYCYALGRMASRFVARATKLGLYEK